jgi:CBS domain-containing protein
MNTIGHISEKTHIVSQDEPVSRVKTIFDENKTIHAVVVAEENKPLGLVMKIHLNDRLSQRYGFSLFIKKPIFAVMDRYPMIVHHDEPIEDVSDKAMKRDNTRLYDHIIVLKNGSLHGIVAVRTILNHLVKFQRERSDILERYASRLEQEDSVLFRKQDQRVMQNDRSELNIQQVQDLLTLARRGVETKEEVALKPI